MRPSSNLISDNESRHVEFYSGELLYALYGVKGCCTPKDANQKDRSRFWLQFSQRNIFWVKMALPALLADFRMN